MAACTADDWQLILEQVRIALERIAAETTDAEVVGDE